MASDSSVVSKIGLERGLDGVYLVGEVEHHGAVLLGVSAVEPRQRLHGVHAAELLVHVHRMQQRLVESGLELVGHDQEALLVRIEGLGRLRLRKAVHAGLGVIPVAILDGAGECHQRLERITSLGEIGVHRQLVAHRVQTRTGDDHRLRPPTDSVLHPIGEVLHHDAHLLPDRMRVQLHERLQQIGGLALVVARVVGHRLPQPPIRLIRGVVLQHVQDEVLFDCLAHAVEVERGE